MSNKLEESGKEIVLKEYGRNTQKIVNYILTIQDKDKRTKYANTLIELMKQINPGMRDAQDSYHKLWDHLYIMADFNLDVDSIYPMPEKELLGRKPMKVDYNTHNLRFKHYGKNVELLIEKAIHMEDKTDKEAAIIYIGRLMKRFYATWNKENIEDDVIIEHLLYLSNNKLELDIDKIKSERLFDSYMPKEHREKDQSEYKERREYRNNGGNGNNNYGSNNNNRKYNNNNNNNRRNNNNNNNNRQQY